MAKKTLRYSEALKELNEILEGLEEESIDVDEVALKVKRASELIKLCRDRIEKTEMEVRKVVEEFDKNGQAQG